MTPDGWQKRRFGDFCIEVVRRAEEEDFPVLSVSKDHGLLLQSEKFKKRIASKDTSRYKRIRYGEFAYDPMLLWSGSIGRQKRIAEGVISPAYYAFQTDSTVDPEFFETLLRWPGMRPRFSDISQGTNVRRRKASFEDFCAIVWTFPSLQEQRKIAAILSSADDAIEKTRAVINQLEVVKKCVLGELMTRGMPGRHARYVETPLGLVPESWSLYRLEQVADFSSGTTPSRRDPSNFCVSGGYWWVKTMDLNGDAIENTDEQISERAASSIKVFPPGTVLVAMYGGFNQIGRSGYLAVSAATNQAICVISLDAQRVIPEFCNWWLIANRWRWKAVAASSRKDPNITRVDVAAFPIAVPSIEEQVGIVSTLRGCQQRIQAEARVLQALRTAKAALLDALISGKRRVLSAPEEAA